MEKLGQQGESQWISMLVDSWWWCLLLHVTYIGIMVLFLVYCSSCLENATPSLMYDGSSPPRGWTMTMWYDTWLLWISSLVILYGLTVTWHSSSDGGSCWLSLFHGYLLAWVDMVWAYCLSALAYLAWFHTWSGLLWCGALFYHGTLTPFIGTYVEALLFFYIMDGAVPFSTRVDHFTWIDMRAT